MSTLPKPVLRQMGSAYGWLALGDWEEANTEIEALPAEFKTDPIVLNIRLEIYRAGKMWARMADISKHLIEMEPGEGGHWLNYSYGLRRSEGLEAAREVLERAKSIFPGIDLVWFNLACYCAQLGFLEEARFSLAKAVELNPECLKSALTDTDLKPLWEELGTAEC